MKLLIVLMGLFCVPAMANVGSELEKAFSQLGGLSNASRPSAYQAQSAGYYNGGSLYMRSPVHNAQLASVTLPSFNGGCSGIDLHMGGFSFISKAQARDLAKNIMSDGVSYAFNLALETASPMIANTFKDLRNVANAVNATNINSCEAAVNLVGATFPKTKAAQKAVCQDIGAGKGGMFGDYTSARMGCGNGGQMSSVLKDANTHQGYEKTLADKMNFAWKAIKNNAFLSSNTDIAELFMSVTGTIIVRHDGNDDANNYEFVLPSLLAKEDLLSTLLHGGTAQSYKCDTHDENGCLNPHLEKNLRVLQKDALIYRVEHKINSIVEKIKDDTQELTGEEKGFLQSTRLPIYKMLNVQSAFTQDRGILDVATYSELIASDILFKYLDEVVHAVEAEFHTLQIPVEKRDAFEASLRQVRGKIKDLKQDNYHYQSIANQLIEQTILIEQRLASNLKKINDSNQWADSF